jgi:dipeptidyl aminopeptidase/acylaminoacyl peptidase
MVRPDFTSAVRHVRFAHQVAIAAFMAAAGCQSARVAQPLSTDGRAAAPSDPDVAIRADASEAPILGRPVQLTSATQFRKAGESYFSPDGARVIFQAVPAAEGTGDDAGYAMFLADVVRVGGVPVQLSRVRQISPPMAHNTCGWFHPTDPNIVIFGTTVTAPAGDEVPGYQRGTSRYRWAFPPEMRVVQVRLDPTTGEPGPLEAIAGDGTAYAAEGSISPDGRALLFTKVDPVTQGDLWVKDLATGEERAIVVEPGYDGGPFFSPDGRSIIYRSDRNNDNLLQLFTADVVRDTGGRITGVSAERALTSNPHVNWCPFYHPSGSMAAYATSEIGHDNYEVFLVDVRDPSRRVRVTHVPGADVLPAFSPDGRLMIWTSKRDGSGTSQLWCAAFDPDAARAALDASAGQGAAPPAATSR